MKAGSNLKLFFVVVLIIFISCSCNKEKYDVIPDVYVDFTIDLYDVEFSNLNAIGNYAYIDARTNNWGQSAAGYDGNGIIVYSNTLDTFAAYDRTCPHDYAVNGKSIKVNTDFTLAVCPECGTSFALTANGTPASGPSQYPLKNYKTSFDGRFVHVWNNR
jgi:nitrite reductase/ring-hydroxylating ferredoxin subunit